MHVLAYQWGFGEVLWTIFVVFFTILAIWLFVAVVVDIFWRIDLSGWAKAGWLVLLLILPILGALIYLIARPDDLVWWERRRERL
jgi:Phospholipase_D-nuclease N-terminal